MNTCKRHALVLMPNRSRLNEHLLTRVLRPHDVSVDELEVGLCHPPGRGARSNESAVKKPNAAGAPQFLAPPAEQRAGGRRDKPWRGRLNPDPTGGEDSPVG